MCRWTLCTRTIPCSANKDCPDGQVCIDGVCRPDPNRPGIGTDVVGIVTYYTYWTRYRLY